ncbi:uncharacterized protein BP5553_04100 [Venustampulla echinocandica]|uniref:Rhomboid family membrane protein n=1 Tax=Venustampulla echinocandica TaxID=2656787 RepID=A0A370TW56_9HELO|nr:uncharacterized protein BP5553_04100 [Venustampulla echinocandica]RDL39760.1 hypothetical protein BP5553_04100 [Venustampulla echinocandica]
MSPTSQAPPTSSQESSPNLISRNDASRAQVIHAVSVVSVIICPLILALPPRKLDIYTLALLTGTFTGGNQLAQTYTGRSIVARIQEASMGKQTLPQLAYDTAIAKEKGTLGQKAFERRVDSRDGLAGRMNTEAPTTNTRILEELRRKKEAEEGANSRAVLENSDPRAEKPDWKKERDKREQDAFEEGKGYGDLIMDQIWEVWSWGKQAGEGVKTKDEKPTTTREGK